MTANRQSARPRSLAILVIAWLILQIGGLFTPGLLDDVDSVYIEIAREMLHRHDFVTPYIDGISFFDKPPLMYWLAAGSMKVFGESDWAARLPLALSVLALLLAIYALGRFLAPPEQAERAALYAALAFATAIGPYLYTRFFIPDILICLWMTLGVHAFLLALQRVQERTRSSLIPSLCFAATLALNLLTKGLIGLVFPLAFVLLYLAITRQLRLLLKLHLIPATLFFLAIALPWHILAALRNPAIAMPAGLGLPAKAGWAWFYLYNEHIARFLGRRIPQDYGNTPIWLFWFYAFLWMMPWAVFLPAILRAYYKQRRSLVASKTALTLLLWSLVVLGFFTISHRQEYYSLPALPALALMAGIFLARADESSGENHAALLCHRFLLLPIAALVAVTCGFFAVVAPSPQPGSDLSSLLSSNPALYNLSLGHIFDLTGAAMGFFRGPLIAVALGMIVLGPVSYSFRRRAHTYAANIILACGMALVLLAAHEGLARFYPILGSKGLALAIVQEQQSHPPAGDQQDLILLDGELTSGSSLLFYTRQPVHLVNGRVNGPWFGSFWPDSPHIFENEATLRQLWAGPHRVFLLTAVPASRTTNLQPYGPVHTLVSAGGKTILTNR